MTEFEQQVFSAMMTATHRGTMRPLEWEQAIRVLAPRVAAAIQAAHDDGAADGWGRSIGMAESALPALKGEP